MVVWGIVSRKECAGGGGLVVVELVLETSILLLDLVLFSSYVKVNCRNRSKLHRIKVSILVPPVFM